MEKQLAYKDISLKPERCIVGSRGNCKTDIFLGEKRFAMPVCAANMKSVVDTKTCEFFAKNGWFYIMHRFDVNVGLFMHRMKEFKLFTSISVGINYGSYNILEGLLKDNSIPDYITIDVANAWSDKTMKMAAFIKKNFPNTFLIVGNVATREAIEEIEQWGAGAIKIGLAGGSTCITRNKTAVFRPMVSTIRDCVSARKKAFIIADGGIVEHGDIAKALASGCFCGDEKVITKNGKKYIRDIEINDEVYTHMGDLQKVKNKLQKFYNNKLIKINGIKTTLNHEFYVVHKNDIDKVNDENLVKYAKWISASALTKEYFLIKLEK